MITLIKAAAIRSEINSKVSSSLTTEDCQKYLAQYTSLKVRLWAYNCSLSRLVLRIHVPAGECLTPIDLVFVGMSDIRCPVYWTFGSFAIVDDQKSAKTIFTVPSADVSISASSLVIVVQDEYPQKWWELDRYGS